MNPTKLTRPNPVPYTLGEEIANSVTHGIGAALSIAGLTVLVVFACLYGDPWRVIGVSVYGATLVTLYLVSTLYHSFRSPAIKHIFRILDHSAIFLLIAGTYTPFTLINLRGEWGWTLFGLIWSLAFVGIVLKIFLTGRFGFLSSLVYVGMGWVVVIALRPVVEALPSGGLLLLFVGGLAYTGGLVFYAARKIPYNHAIWHVFVMAGSAAHFIAVLFYSLPPR